MTITHPDLCVWFLLVGTNSDIDQQILTSVNDVFRLSSLRINSNREDNCKCKDRKVALSSFPTPMGKRHEFMNVFYVITSIFNDR